MIYYLHIFGTNTWDCKWLFHNEELLNTFLRQLPLTELTIEKYSVDEDREYTKPEKIEYLKGDKALEYWEDHIHITEIGVEKLKNFHNLFKAPYWTLPESPILESQGAKQKANRARVKKA